MTELSADAPLTGRLLIDGDEVEGRAEAVRGIDPRTRQTLEPAFGGATAEDVARACRLAGEAFDTVPLSGQVSRPYSHLVPRY